MSLARAKLSAAAKFHAQNRLRFFFKNTFKLRDVPRKTSAKSLCRLYVDISNKYTVYQLKQRFREEREEDFLPIGGGFLGCFLLYIREIRIEEKSSSSSSLKIICM
jgi:hypothetical protein